MAPISVLTFLVVQGHLVTPDWFLLRLASNIRSLYLTILRPEMCLLDCNTIGTPEFMLGSNVTSFQKSSVTTASICSQPWLSLSHAAWIHFFTAFFPTEIILLIYLFCLYFSYEDLKFYDLQNGVFPRTTHLLNEHLSMSWMLEKWAIAIKEVPWFQGRAYWREELTCENK